MDVTSALDNPLGARALGRAKAEYVTSGLDSILGLQPQQPRPAESMLTDDELDRLAESGKIRPDTATMLKARTMEASKLAPQAMPPTYAPSGPARPDPMLSRVMAPSRPVEHESPRARVMEPSGPRRQEVASAKKKDAPRG